MYKTEKYSQQLARHLKLTYVVTVTRIADK